MSKVITVRINFDINTSSAKEKVTDMVIQAELAERLILRTLSIVRQLSGDDNLNNFISKTQRAIALVNQLRIITMLLMAQNPWLVAIGAIGLAGTVASMGDIIGSYG